MYDYFYHITLYKALKPSLAASPPYVFSAKTWHCLL